MHNPKNFYTNAVFVKIVKIKMVNKRRISCYNYRHFNDSMFNTTPSIKRICSIRWMNSNVMICTTIDLTSSSTILVIITWHDVVCSKCRKRVYISTIFFILLR
ncbi:unnamed protein product [Rhizophagus irregularis]|nr:unnamed protein product [Rhizophagus irregularis]CAB4442715.1 unnamed protein product [Rhizophagus irregularis]